MKLKFSLTEKKKFSFYWINKVIDPKNQTKVVPVTIHRAKSTISKVDEKFISAPLENSFIHAAHGAANPSESWGSPESISVGFWEFLFLTKSSNRLKFWQILNSRQYKVQHHNEILLYGHREKHRQNQ